MALRRVCRLLVSTKKSGARQPASQPAKPHVGDVKKASQLSASSRSQAKPSQLFLSVPLVAWRGVARFTSCSRVRHCPRRDSSRLAWPGLASSILASPSPQLALRQPTAASQNPIWKNVCALVPPNKPSQQKPGPVPGLRVIRLQYAALLHLIASPQPRPQARGWKDQDQAMLVPVPERQRALRFQKWADIGEWTLFPDSSTHPYLLACFAYVLIQYRTHVFAK